MNFWQEIYDAAKDRRYGMLFFGTFLGFVAMVVVGLMIYAAIGREQFGESAFPVLIVIFALVIFSLWRFFRDLKNRRGRAERGLLSRDEIRKARSKLSKMKPAGRPIPRPPDIDLKY